MQIHIINRQVEIISSYVGYLENSSKYIEVLDASLLREKISNIKKVFRYPGPHQAEYLSRCDAAIVLLEFDKSRYACSIAIGNTLSCLHSYRLELEKSLSKVDRTVAVHY
ncbi:MAG: hypothetical protein K0Q79_2812 [Flavipsychrobacter sp.]|jgi:hypothetical protein|nr:hypothetical protein [Flavipsychrobacter sp.]